MSLSAVVFFIGVDFSSISAAGCFGAVFYTTNQIGLQVSTISRKRVRIVDVYIRAPLFAARNYCPAAIDFAVTAGGRTYQTLEQLKTLLEKLLLGRAIWKQYSVWRWNAGMRLRLRLLKGINRKERLTSRIGIDTRPIDKPERVGLGVAAQCRIPRFRGGKLHAGASCRSAPSSSQRRAFWHLNSNCARG